ncbi:hypothetical protein EXIGLDRAFT_781044 [Exidia glandulosa HHB12029]|uniref:Membrane anchor Opy2 N-terminal domain-containing protein n=1 Tax=Exidia glandulosa HHB12029 TaxID=1314781 RepID=A0A165BDG3_EXIGL|nr:hypothetical protein EXIGLDRAFT_781044 [Exidia glandulosa HHB12029]
MRFSPSFVLFAIAAVALATPSPKVCPDLCVVCPDGTAVCGCELEEKGCPK